MNVRNHRIAAVTILASGAILLFAWGRSMAIDSGEIRAVRDRFQGVWVAQTIRAGLNRPLEGHEAATCSAVFDGKTVRFRGLVGGIDASGTFYIEAAHPGWIDFKLDAGWIIGIYAIDDDTLQICVSPFATPERLGIPTLPRARSIEPGSHRIVYVFRKTSD